MGLDGRDLEQLAELSHTIDKVAVTLCSTEVDDRTVEVALTEAAHGEREALAVALSYALRRREREGATALNERAVAALAGALRRMSRSGDPGEERR